MRVLENNEVKLEYEISPSGSVIKSIVTRKDNWEVVESNYKKYTVDKPLPIGTTYTYTNSDGFEHGFSEIKIEYTVKTPTSFTVNFKSKGLHKNFNLSQNLIRFMLWNCFEEVKNVCVCEDRTLEVFLHSDSRKVFDKNFFEAFSQEFIDEIETYEDYKNLREYVVEILKGFMGCEDDEEFKMALELTSKIYC